MRNNTNCEKCLGHGIIKQEEKKCIICEGKKCISCNEKGFEKMPYDECDKCFGSGKININF